MNTPTKITFSRIIAIVLMMITLIILNILGDKITPQFLGNSEINLVFFIVFVFFVLASFTDFLDGHLARKNNQITDLGKFLDPVADKLLINSIIIFLIAPQLSAPYVVNQINIVWWCAALIVARDIVVDALRFMGAKKNIVIAANYWGKAKTVLEMVLISFTLLNGWPFLCISNDAARIFIRILTYITTAVSLISGIIYVVRNKKVFVEEK